jgi:hypothetical protein
VVPRSAMGKHNGKARNTGLQVGSALLSKKVQESRASSALKFGVDVLQGAAKCLVLTHSV